jgi:hypothetical protein
LGRILHQLPVYRSSNYSELRHNLPKGTPGAEECPLTQSPTAQEGRRKVEKEKEKKQRLAKQKQTALL